MRRRDPPAGAPPLGHRNHPLPDRHRGNDAIGDPLDSTVSSRVSGSFSVVGGDGNDRIFFAGTESAGAWPRTWGNGGNLTVRNDVVSSNGLTTRHDRFVYLGPGSKRSTPACPTCSRRPTDGPA